MRARRFAFISAALPSVLLLAGCEGIFGLPGNGAGAQRSQTAGPLVAATVARRLTQQELDMTLLDLLGDDTRAASRLLTPDSSQPFDNDYTGQLASQALIDAAELMAEQVSTAALANQTRRAAIVPCTPTGKGDTACFRAFVASFGKRALRRPLTEQEIQAYMGLQQYSIENNQYVPTDFYTGVDFVVRAMLQDPEFLYRVEHARSDDALDDYELASRLSYLLWGTMPDAALFAAADKGELVAPDSRRAHAERMLSDARARRQVNRFHAMWLGYTTVPHPKMLADAFATETSKLIERVVFDEKRDYFDLFRMPETYLTPTLGEHYGTPVSAAGFVPYSDPDRAGILSHGSVLSGFGKFSDTSPTQRGIFVRTRLLCETVAPPPPDVNVDDIPGTGTDAVCKIDRYIQHRRSASCTACHGQLDPIGFGLEAYDLGGRKRTHDDGHPECIIDAKGDLPGVGEFSGPKQLSERLLASGKLEACVVKQVYRFAVGRELSQEESESATRYWLPKWRDEGFRMDTLLLDLIASNEFGQRREPQ